MQIIAKQFLSILIICALSISHGLAYKLPELGDASRKSLSVYEEKQLGKKFITIIKTYLPLSTDNVVHDYIQNIGYRLISHSLRPEINYHFFVVNSANINAFAGPDGYLGINAGLILAAHSEDELAAVMAHEIAHISQGHISRYFSEGKKLQLSMLAGLIAAIIAGCQNPNAAIGLLTATSAGAQQHFLTFSRHNESEADRIGMQTLASSDFDPKSMPRFFNRLAKKTQFNDSDKIPEFLRTHPLTENRLADIQNRSTQYTYHKNNSKTDFPLIQARTAIELSIDPFNSARHYKKLLSNTKNSNNTKLQYAYTLALLKINQLQLAKKNIQQLINKHPSQILFKMSLSDIEQASDHPQKALKILASIYQYQPDYYPLIIQYAKTLITNKQSKKAQNILKGHIDLYEQDETFLYLLSEAQAKSGNKAEAYQTLAQIYLQNDNKKKAKQLLETALQYVQHDPYNKRRIKAKLKGISKL